MKDVVLPPGTSRIGARAVVEFLKALGARIP